MIKLFENGILTVTREDGAVLIQDLHPERYNAWRSEEEALAFTFNDRYPFLMPEVVVDPTAPISEVSV
jgi:hypothetical protein